jgi:hypothetical protein
MTKFVLTSLQLEEEKVECATFRNRWNSPVKCLSAAGRIEGPAPITDYRNIQVPTSKAIKDKFCVGDFFSLPFDTPN